jgi:hypothetical protein
MTSLALDKTWDLYVDANGNIATVSGSANTAQDVACQARLFAGELWHDTTQGVAYNQILGQRPSISFVKDQINAAAQLVPSVIASAVYLTGFNGRTLSGQIQTTDTNGNLIATNF